MLWTHILAIFNKDNSDTWETPLLFLQVLRANSPTQFPSLPLVSLFATCVPSSAAAPCLCLYHHPDPSHLPSSSIPLPISPTMHKCFFRIFWWPLLHLFLLYRPPIRRHRSRGEQARVALFLLHNPPLIVLIVRPPVDLGVLVRRRPRRSSSRGPRGRSQQRGPR